MNISKNLIAFCLLILTLSISACTGLTRSDQAASKTWWLKPYAGMTQETPPAAVLPVAISVTVVPGLDTDRILTLSEDARLNQFAAARWADNLPELASSLVGRTLESTGRFKILSERVGAGTESCDLQLELQEFFAGIGTSGQTVGVSVAINGRYQCEFVAPVLIKLKASIPVHDERMNVIVAAFQQALDSVMKEMLTQIP